VTVLGFGTFSTADRAARPGRNPKTGAEIQIPAKTIAKFKPGKDLAESINK
jgi:DNA-binding protein HU-beta